MSTDTRPVVIQGSLGSLLEASLEDRQKVVLNHPEFQRNKKSEQPLWPFMFLTIKVALELPLDECRLFFLQVSEKFKLIDAVSRYLTVFRVLSNLQLDAHNCLQALLILEQAESWLESQGYVLATATSDGKVQIGGTSYVPNSRRFVPANGNKAIFAPESAIPMGDGTYGVKFLAVQ